MVVTTVWPLPHPHFLQKTATLSTYAKQTRGSFEPASEVPFTCCRGLPLSMREVLTARSPTLALKVFLKFCGFLFCFKISTNYGPLYYKVNCDLQIRGTSTCHRPPFQNSGSSKTCFLDDVFLPHPSGVNRGQQFGFL